MHLSRRIAALLAAALVAGAPAVAHAQGSAGDEQYQDPFGGATNGAQGNGGRGSSSQSGSSGSSGTQAAPAPAPATSSSTSPSTTGSTPAAPAASSAGARQELPRTGLDAPVIALLGIGLLAAGIGLRLRLRAVDGRR